MMEGEVEEEPEFVPLRKKQRNDYGQEDNHVPSYYQETSEASNRSEEDIDGEHCPNPTTNFYEMGLPTDIIYRLFHLGIEYPTPIQMQCCPAILSGRDVIGNAETGSGKTLAYVLPLLVHLRHRMQSETSVEPNRGPIGLILVPTRELVEQIFQEIEKFTSPTRNPYLSHTIPTTHQHEYLPQVQEYRDGDLLYSHVTPNLPTAKILGVIGGVSVQSQLSSIHRSGVDVVIATPGRLLDLIDRGAITTDRLTYLVFDEADRMLSLNMEDQLRKFVAGCTQSVRQTLLFSATMPTSVTRLARSAVMNPIYIAVGEVGQLAQSVIHNVVFVDNKDKRSSLLRLLRETPRPPVIVFCNHSYVVDRVVDWLKEEQFHAVGIHSNKSQNYRNTVMKTFREGGVDVLVASDLVSRGIDVAEVEHVILYDIPDTIEDYVHRSGRTGRKGREGYCSSLLTWHCKIAPELKKLLREAQQQMPVELERDTRLFGKDIVSTEFGDHPRDKMKYKSLR
ncbi:hypothetical protein PROFUN_02365 [Planoprotostelium fungivorum]|uniref:RNA helicase n=1 Tax=Planoprotostelium fungivorum TaxID=1890364 RepID=A0A2P6NUL8_9EUKA|nr:hypothetical protein PROFUN_02350 [Planoprotostelium fungivorum]PRP87665.1 hypothetical protein PROFUN_02365 [Planoprotostelium fungivorum]